MTIEEKIDVIKENKDAAAAALTSYLDSIYNMVDKYFDKDGSLKEGLVHDEKIEKMIWDYKADSVKYEKVRTKIKKNDFNLSLFEINLVGLAFLFVTIRLEKQIKTFEEARKASSNIVNQLIDSESKTIDFSKEV
jgi:hypothetical protein